MKYSKDANGTPQPMNIIVGSVPPHPSCSYSTVNSCKFMNSTTITLVKCNHEGCENKLHHMCQAEYATASGFKERGGVSEQKLCPKHVGPLARNNDTFNEIAAKARALASIRTPDLHDRSDRAPNTKEMQDAITSSSIDPSQTRIVVNHHPERNLKGEWGKSMAFPISQISNRFKSLQL